MTSASPSIRPDTVGHSLSAIILAAGYSSRMGELKPLLPLNGIPALEQAILAFREADVRDIVVVLGHKSSRLHPIVEKCGARGVLNLRFHEGMFSSVLAGAASITSIASGAFLLPADISLVRAATIRQLASAFSANSSGIVYPTFARRRGHPPVISRSILSAILNATPAPLHSILAGHESAAVDVPVADQAIHMDMDTPADYEALRLLAAHREIPTREECEAMLLLFATPEPRLLHARKVAEVAARIASHLIELGVLLNLDLVQAGALLHDLAKGRPDHAIAGADTLLSMGFPGVSEIVAAHTDLHNPRRLDESAIVYLADKVVRGGTIVTLHERFAPALERFSHEPAALASAQRRMRDARMVAANIEGILGKTIAEILQDNAAPASTQPVDSPGREGAPE